MEESSLQNKVEDEQADTKSTATTENGKTKKLTEVIAKLTGISCACFRTFTTSIETSDEEVAEAPEI